MAGEVVLVYTVCASEEEALKISRSLVRERLCACTNYWPIRSVYEWNGQLSEDGEVALLAKTTAERVEQVFLRVLELHSYELPCLLSVRPDRVDRVYADWVARGASAASRA